MNKSTMKKILFITAALLTAYITAAATNYDTESFPALDTSLGARGTAIGSYTAIANDASSVFWNPAGLAKINMLELGAGYDKWLLDSSYQYGTVGMPVVYGAIGGFFNYTGMGTFNERDTTGNLTGAQLSPYNIAGGLAYGAPISDMLQAGIGFRFANFNIDNYSSTGVLMDIGLQSTQGMLSEGINVQGFELTGNFLPENYRLGLGMDAVKTQNFGITAAADANYSEYYGLTYGGGLEIMLVKMLFLRGGYTVAPANAAAGGGISGLSAGVGLQLDKLSFDYSMVSHGDIGITQLVSVKLLYESEEGREKANEDKLNKFLAEQNFQDGQDYFDNGNYKDALSKWTEVKAMAPDYEDIDLDIAKAKKMAAGEGNIKRADKIFAEGMKYYEGFEFDKAVKDWVEVKSLDPGYKDIDSWLSDAKELKTSKGVSKQAVKYFTDGLKAYNDCDYSKALIAWQTGLEKDPNNAKIKQYIERTKVQQQQIQEDIGKAKADVAKDASVVEGVKKLRSIANTCPAYKDATNILSALKELINMKTKEYYYKGIEKYTDGNLDAAIVYWKNIEEIDPKSDYVVKVKHYIENARSKQKALKNMGK